MKKLVFSLRSLNPFRDKRTELEKDIDETAKRAHQRLSVSLMGAFPIQPIHYHNWFVTRSMFFGAIFWFIVMSVLIYYEYWKGIFAFMVLMSILAITCQYMVNKKNS